VSASLAEAGWISHWSKTASASPASKQSPDLFGLFATLRPSIVDAKVSSARPRLKPLSVSRYDGCLADRGLPDGGLADRHFADWSLLIDGLSAREVGSACGSHHGKHCTHYNHNFHHGIPPKLEETKQ
jgi:hypothetical protein